MNKTMAAVILVSLALLVGGIFVSAEIQQNQTKDMTAYETKCGCGCNNECGGTCGFSGCNCAKKLPE